MHGLINRSVQCFLRDTYGAASWAAVARKAELGFDGFEAMLTYEPDITDRVIEAAVHVLGRPRYCLLEDLGTYLVSHPNCEPLRRLLRFGGVSFVDFLDSLEDLPERGRLALPDLDLPLLSLTEMGEGRFILRCSVLIDGVGYVMMGLLRAMADDYGALVFLDHEGKDEGMELVSVHLLDQCYSEGRRFELTAGPA